MFWCPRVAPLLFTAAQLAMPVRAGGLIDLPCDVHQGLAFDKSSQAGLGFLESLSLGKLALARDLLVLDPADPDGWSGLAFAASKTAQPSVTLHALTMRSKYLPEVPSTYFVWAISYDALHDKAAAATYYHHFLDSAAGKYPNQEWQARQRLILLENKK